MNVERIEERSEAAENMTAGSVTAERAYSDEVVRLREALRVARAETQEAREEQRATSEVLEAIKGSLGDAAPVLEKIMESCGRLFAGRIVGLNQVDADGMLRMGVYHGPGREELAKIYPLPLEPSSGSAISILERRVVHYPDVEAVGVPLSTRTGCRAIGVKSVLFAPLLREDRSLGAIYVGRDTLRPFAEPDIALLRTFADQAAIAIENGRLFNEVSRRNAELAEALAQQTATAEILHVISSSPSDVQPVFDAIAERAMTLCGARIGGVARFDGELVHLVSFHAPQRAEGILGRFPMKPSRAAITARAVLEAKPVQVPDVLEDPDYELAAESVAAGFRANLGVPMIHNGKVIGAIGVCREEPGVFSDKQVRLLQTFAEQAVIAIENVRLFNETREALERQTATAEILRVISSSPTDVQPVFDAVAERAGVLCRAERTRIWLVHDGRLEAVTRFWPGSPGEGLGETLPLDRTSVAGRAVLEQCILHVDDIVPLLDTEYPAVREVVTRYGTRTTLMIPLLRDGIAIGAIALLRSRIEPFTPTEISLLQTFADQAVIAIENVRLFNETKEALERQTATAEILRVISSSPTSTAPVFDAIATSARALCNARTANVVTFDGTELHLAARAIDRPIAGDTAADVFPRPIGNDTAAGRAIVSRRIAMIPDVLDDGDYAALHVARTVHSRSFLGVPLLREENPIGAIVVGRTQVGPFPDKQIALLQTFADQAVIAIENARLFRELEQRNRDAAEALERQTATAGILRVISSSPTSTSPVFHAILESSARLCEADMGLVLRYEDGVFLTVKTLVPDPAFDDYLHKPIVAGPLTGLGRIARTKAAVHIPDLVDDIAYRERDPLRVRSVELGGVRTWLGVPMLRDGELIGAIAIYRKEVRPFEPRQIEVLRTFADQAVIAIENVRLFNETKEALETQTATAEILNVISQSPTNVQPVFDAIADRARVLCNAVIAGVTRFDGEWVHLVSQRGASREAEEVMNAVFPVRPGSETMTARAVRDRAPVQCADVMTDPEFGPKAAASYGGFRSVLAVPMLKDGEVIGSIGVNRAEAGPFTERQVKLLQTFADQAVIAIENVRLFNELREKTVQLELASRHKSEFLANMSHELRTPLNAIIGFTRIVMRRSHESLEPRQYENLEKILQSGQNLLALINSILDLAKVEAGRVEIRPAEVALVSLLGDCARTIEPLLEDGEVELVRAFDDAPPLIHADEEKLRQIVINLLSNAAKFTPKGSIRIEARSDGDGVTIAVTDTGIGIPADKLDLVFEEFEQAGRTGSDIQRGTGLGLTISRRLARLMGGDITAQSTLGAGSTFTLLLPLRYSGPA